MLEIVDVKNADGSGFNYMCFRDLRAFLPKTETVNVTVYDKGILFRGLVKDLPDDYDTYTVMRVEAMVTFELNVFLTDVEVIK